MLDVPSLSAPLPPIQHSGDVSPNRGIVASLRFLAPKAKASGRDGSEPTRRMENECPALATDKLHQRLHERSPNGRRMNYRP